MLKFTKFAIRNAKFSATNIRSLPAVRKAMREFDKEYPACAWCGREGDTDIHHIMPVSIAPHLAADKTNFIPLCRQKKCHFVVGHYSNWKDFNARVADVCACGTVSGR